MESVFRGQDHCFFSSRLKMRISRKSESRKRRSTALPKEPVPPVIKSTLLSNMYPPRFVVLPARRDTVGSSEAALGS